MTFDDRDSASSVNDEQGGSRSSRSKEKHQLPLWQETILLLGVALVLAVVIKAFFVQAFYIPSESMEPGLIKNDRILVQKWSYWGGGTVQRGDVVVFKDPGDWLAPQESAGPDNIVAKGLEKVGLYPSGGHLVKRVIGVEGDIIACCDKQGRIKVNGVPLDGTEYLRPDNPKTRGFDENGPCDGPMPGVCNWRTGPVPEDKMFVMGDNRQFSADSTVHMCSPRETECVPGREFVPLDNVVGKVFALVWPLGRAEWIGRPDDFDKVNDEG